MNFVEELRNDDGIRERKLADNISSFNFTSKTFKKRNWNSRTIKARGLFVDTENNEIVARSYDKFFAIGERPETQMSALKKNLSFPVFAYVKENGFLGIVAGRDDGTLFVASKSTNEGDFAKLFKSILEESISEAARTCLANWLYQYDLSLVFEVIDPYNDPHIVRYNKAHIVLLDIIENEIDFKPMSIGYVRDLANQLNIPYKLPVGTVFSFEELENLIDYWNYRTGVEGLVLCDSNNFMFKLKTLWYKEWKNIRGIAQQLANKPAEEVKSFKKLEEENPALANCLKKHIAEHGFTDIISLRNEIYEDACTRSSLRKSPRML